MKTSAISPWVLILAGVTVATALAWQQRSISRLRSAIEQSKEAAPTAVAPAPPLNRTQAVQRPTQEKPVERIWVPSPSPAPDDDLSERVSALEASVATLHRGAEHLMDRGEIPPSEAKASEWRVAFLDASLPANDRIAALRMLRRNGLFDDQMAQSAASWLSMTTDPGEQRALLEHLRGADNAALKHAMLNMAATSEDTRVRQRAVSNLRNYLDDPQVEPALWQMLSSDSSREVQHSVVDTLRRIPMTEARASNLRAGAMNPSTPLNERLAALHMLQAGEQDIADIAFQLAQAAEQAADNQTQLRYIEAFDDVNDPEFMAPLVTAVQNESPDVRVRAADALVDYRNEPVIAEWLVHLAENDPDPRVREEASRVYREDGRRYGGRRR